MFSLSPPERKILIFIASIIFLGTLVRYFNLEVDDVIPSSALVSQSPLKININQASETCLQKLPGIGPVLSRRIIEYRESQKPFEEISDLKNVSGIGSHKAEAIKEYLEF